MKPILDELLATMPDGGELIRVVMRLLAALAVGALIGYERERMGKDAGLRTHMLVSVGTALLVICAIESGMHEDAVSRVIQGIVTGIGFLGAGVIMKIQEAREIRGLTTAAGIWMTAAAGVAIGLGASRRRSKIGAVAHHVATTDRAKSGAETVVLKPYRKAAPMPIWRFDRLSANAS